MLFATVPDTCSVTNTPTKNRIISTRGNENSTRDLNKLIPLVDRCTTYTNYYCVEEKTVKLVFVK